MRVIRLASQIAVAALCASGTPAMAHSPTPTATARFVPLDQAMHDLSAATKNWFLARKTTERIVAASENAPLVADDMADAVRLGNQALSAIDAELVENRHDLDDGWRSDRIEAIVWRLWACVAHIVNAQPGPAARIWTTL